MVGGRLCCLSCVFTLRAVLLLGLCRPDVEASSCQKIIFKKVGDTVEISSCLPTEGVTFARWSHNDKRIAGTTAGVKEDLRDKFSLNPTNFSLTVRNLNLQDSGEYTLLSTVNSQQGETVVVTLHVHEPITEQPGLTFNSTWDPLKKICKVFLECSSTSHANVRYSWSDRNRTWSGSRLQTSIRPEDGDAVFTCTVSNVVSETSASDTVTCAEKDERRFLFLHVAVGGCLMILSVVGITVCVCLCRRKSAGAEENDLTVYADVGDVAVEDGSSTIKPCSLYETIDDRLQQVRPVTPMPTVYDKIQFTHTRKVSSPYQEI